MMAYGVPERASASGASDAHCSGARKIFSKCPHCRGYGRTALCKTLALPEAANGEQSCAKCCYFCVHNNGFVAESSRGLALGRTSREFGQESFLRAAPRPRECVQPILA